MSDHYHQQHDLSRELVVSSRRLQAVPDTDHKGLTIFGPNGHAYAPTHWAFGQLAQLAEAPAAYLRTVPAELAADCINYGLQFKRQIEDVGVLLYKDGVAVLRAATGPKYGRVWNGQVVDALVSRFGDGLSGDFRVPGEFGQRGAITKDNTTLYGGDRDMFVFLADEEHRIELPNRRDGEPGSLARGFFTWNSETGKTTLGVATFLFDYACSNRIVWGTEGYEEIAIRHSAGAPDRFIEEISPALTSYANSSTDGVVRAIESARKARIEHVGEFLSKRFGRRVVADIQQAHEREEGRPIETLWDATTAITAYARSIEHQDRRVDVERIGGEVLAMAA
jgi:hypothetical protein